MDRQYAVARFGDGNKWLKWQMQALLRLERVFDNLVRLGEACFRVTAFEMIIERDVGVGFALKMLEIGKCPGRFEHLVHDNIGLQRLDFVIHRRQLFILGGNQLHRLVGDMRIARQDGGDRLTDVAHFVDGEDRLIVECRAVVRLRDQFLNVLPGDDAINTRQCARRFDVNASYPAMGHGRTENFGIHHAGQLQMMRVVGPPGNLGAHFQPRNRLADLVHYAPSIA